MSGGMRQQLKRQPPNELSAAIRRVRMALGDTMDAFGARLGTTHAQVSQWEFGRQKPEVFTLLRIGALAQGADRKWFVEMLRVELGEASRKFVREVVHG